MCSLLQYKSLNIQAISQYMDLINQLQDSHNITLNNITESLSSYGDQYPVSLICQHPMPAHYYVCCWLPIISKHMILYSYSLTFSVHSYSLTFSVHGLTHNLIKDGT
jgi:hypothetical protein